MFRLLITLFKLHGYLWSQKTEITVSFACRNKKQADAEVLARSYHRRFAYFHQSELWICEVHRSQF